MDARDPRLTLGRFLADATARHGERRAVHFEGRDWLYRDLEREARALARGLVAAGVVKGARVALLLANRPEWIAAAAAVGRLGGVVVPVNTFATRDELAAILCHDDASLLLMQPSLLRRRYLDELLEAHPALARGRPGALRVPELPQLRAVHCLGLDARRGGVAPWDELVASGAGVDDALVDALCAQVEPSDDAFVIHTSGSTAQPKGVLHTHRAALLQAWRFAELLRFDADERVFTTYPFFWTAGIAMSIGATLAAGGCLLLEQAFEPGAALELIERERASAVHMWPHQSQALAEHPDAARRDLSSVRKVDFSSPVARLAGITRDGYGTGASYGLSETFTIASMLPADAPAELRRSSHGRTLPGMEIRIVDPETGAPVATGEPGEIAVRGATLMRGYTGVPPELVFDADGWFRTRDGGSLDAEGHLHWTGRLSNLIKTGGANVSPLEIEERAGRFPGVRSAHALGVPHPTLGDAIVLLVLPTGGGTLDVAALQAFLREGLSAYKLPRAVFVLRPDEVSYTGSQKVQQEPLRERALAKLGEAGVEIAGYVYGR